MVAAVGVAGLFTRAVGTEAGSDILGKGTAVGNGFLTTAVPTGTGLGIGGTEADRDVFTARAVVVKLSASLETPWAAVSVVAQSTVLAFFLREEPNVVSSTVDEQNRPASSSSLAQRRTAWILLKRTIRR